MLRNSSALAMVGCFDGTFSWRLAIKNNLNKIHTNRSVFKINLFPLVSFAGFGLESFVVKKESKELIHSFILTTEGTRRIHHKGTQRKIFLQLQLL